MRYSVDWTRKALRDLKRLDKPEVNRIVGAVVTFAETGYGDVKKLTNAGGQLRLRVGEWRVRFTLEDEVQILSVIRVLPRGAAYKNM